LFQLVPFEPLNKSIADGHRLASVRQSSKKDWRFRWWIPNEGLEWSSLFSGVKRFMVSQPLKTLKDAEAIQPVACLDLDV
jgi:hypothetical protein